MNGTIAVCWGLKESQVHDMLTYSRASTEWRWRRSRGLRLATTEGAGIPVQ